MTRLSQKFEFSASHRLFNPKFSDEENLKTFGKCSNPHGHGHNYELQVTLRGRANEKGLLMDIPAFERIVREAVISLERRLRVLSDRLAPAAVPAGGSTPGGAVPGGPAWARR